MVINMLDIDIGAAPCDDYYYIGQDGLISPHLCETIQYFAYEPCGCEYGIVVDNNGDERNPDPVSPTAAPSPKLPSFVPSASPSTAAPTSNSPTKSPITGSPTDEPTIGRTDKLTSSPTGSPTEAVNVAPGVESESPLSPSTSFPPSTVSPTILRQPRAPLDEGKESIAKMSGDSRGGAGGFRRRLKGR